MQGFESPNRNGGGLLIGHIGGLDSHHRIFTQTGIFRITTETQPGPCKHLIAFPKSLYSFACGFNFPG